MELLSTEFKKVWGVYKIYCKTSKKSYYGSSKNLYKRIVDHRRELRKNIHCNLKLQNAWNKYGEDSFVVTVVEILQVKDQRQLRDRETYYIQKYKTHIRGYNICSIGSGTSEADFTEERKKHISESLKGRTAHNKGVPMSEEQKALLKKVNREKRGKKVDIYKVTGEFIETLDSIKAVTEKYNVTKSTVSLSCQGKKNNKTYIFLYHGESFKNNNYSKNTYFGNVAFEVWNNSNQKLGKFKFALDVVEFLTGKRTKNGNILRMIRTCKNIGDSVSYKNYLIKKVCALDDSNIINEQRQSDNLSEVSNIDANGEA